MNNYRPFLIIQLKSFYRSFLSKREQGLLTIYALLAGCIVYCMWVVGQNFFRFIDSFPASLFTNFIYTSICCGIFWGDFILKLLFRNNTQPHPLMQCLPGYKSVCSNWYYLSQSLSLWNLYPFVFLFHLISYYLLPTYGAGSTILFCIGIYLIGLLNSNLVAYLKINTHKLITGIGCFVISTSAISFFNMATLVMQVIPLIFISTMLVIGNILLLKDNYTTLRYFENNSRSTINHTNRSFLISSDPYFTYTWLYLKMIFRSPRLKQQLITLGVLCLMYFYMIISNKTIMENFLVRLVFYPFILAIIPLTLNQYLFSGEGSFFSRLLTLSSFPQFLKVRYLIYFSIIAVIYVILLIFNKNSIFELTALFLFCAGPLTLSSFLNIFFVTHKQDLSVLSKNWSEPPQGNVILNLLLMVALFLPVILLNIFVSTFTAICYMAITGVVSLVYANKFLNQIYDIYMRSAKYKQLEIFRD